MHWRPVLMLTLGLAAAACAREAQEAPPVAARSAASEEVVAEMARCANPQAGYRVAYPAQWQTNPGSVMPECSLFDPEPIQLQAGTEIPLDIAVSIRREPVRLETIAGEPRDERVLSRAETTVAGRRALRIESEATGEVMHPEGTRSYRYLVDLGEETLVAATYEAGTLDFASKRRILDEMMSTLELTDRR